MYEAAAVTLGALGTACIATATPPLLAHAIAGASPRRPAPGSPGPARHLLDGQRLLLAGRLLGATPGQPVIVEFRPRHGAWRPLTGATAGAAGGYRVWVAPPANGSLRVVAGGERARPAAVPPGVVVDPRSAASATSGPEQSVAVSARLTPNVPHPELLAGRPVQLSGALRPARAGRTVVLQARRGRRWYPLARARTGAGGGFRLRWAPRQTTPAPVRLRFDGDSVNAPSSSEVGRIDVYRPALASWFGSELYGSALACGGRLGPKTLGVAHRTLPCGTWLTIRYGRRRVRLRVVDRGPYSGDREFDLTAAAKQRLGFGDIGRVWVSR